MRTDPDLAELCTRIEALVSERAGRRVLIGITGTPGSGKTTLAEALVAALAGGPWIGSRVAHVPMDGFHLADVELQRLGRTDRKGAPDTFDPAGYAALLRRLRTTSDVVWAPAFDREVEQPIAGSIPVLPAAEVIITEGNYLLLDDPVWRSARAELDEVWFCDLDDDVRRRRLVERHIRFGKAPGEAQRWVDGPDQRNAELVSATRVDADLVVREIAEGAADGQP